MRNFKNIDFLTLRNEVENGPTFWRVYYRAIAMMQIDQIVEEFGLKVDIIFILLRPHLSEHGLAN